GRAELTTEHGVGPPAYVYDDLRERLVHRHGRLADADDAAPLAERLVERLPQHDGDILDGMVGVNVKVTLCLDDQVEQAVHGDMVQHVVEEAHAGADLGLARAVEVEGKRDVRLVGLARDGRAAVGHVCCSLSSVLIFNRTSTPPPRSP